MNKKYTVNEMLEMDDCNGIDCDECPFKLKERDEKYNTRCKARVYCKKNNIKYDYKLDIFKASSIYIKHLKEQKLLLQDIMDL